MKTFQYRATRIRIEHSLFTFKANDLNSGDAIARQHIANIPEDQWSAAVDAPTQMVGFECVMDDTVQSHDGTVEWTTLDSLAKSCRIGLLVKVADLESIDGSDEYQYATPGWYEALGAIEKDQLLTAWESVDHAERQAAHQAFLDEVYDQRFQLAYPSELKNLHVQH